MRKTPSHEAGFNLIELIIALSILSALAGAAVFSFSGSKSKGQILFSTLAEYGSAMNRMQLDMSCYPKNTGALFNKELAKQNECGDTEAATWRGPYSKTAPLIEDNVNLTSVGANAVMKIVAGDDINNSGNQVDWYLEVSNLPADIATDAYRTCSGTNKTDGSNNGPCGSTPPATTGMTSLRYIFDETT